MYRYYGKHRIRGFFNISQTFFLFDLLNWPTLLLFVCRFTCDKSYSLIGPELKVCSDSERWLDAEGQVDSRVACEEVRCPMPARPNNTVVSISSTERLHGTSVIR